MLVTRQVQTLETGHNIHPDFVLITTVLFFLRAIQLHSINKAANMFILGSPPEFTPVLKIIIVIAKIVGKIFLKQMTTMMNSTTYFPQFLH